MIPPRERTDGGAPPNTATNGFWVHVSRIGDRFDELLPFALFPFLTTLLNVQNVRAALDPATGGMSFNVQFAFPSPFFDLWSLVDPPAAAGSAPNTIVSDGTDVTVDSPIPLDVIGSVSTSWTLLIGVTLGLLVVYALLFAVLQAVYVGGIDRRLRGESFAPGALVVRFAPRFFAYTFVVFGAILVMVPIVLVAPILILLAIPTMLVLGYLFYATPFLFVVEDAGVVEGFRRSYRYALDGEAYLWFGLWHLGVSAVASLGLSVLVNAGPVGFLLALTVATPLSLVLTAATVSFLQELTAAKPGGRRTAGAR